MLQNGVALIQTATRTSPPLRLSPLLLHVMSRVLIPDVSAVRGTWKIHVLRARQPDRGNPRQGVRSAYVSHRAAFTTISFIQEQPHQGLMMSANQSVRHGRRLIVCV